MIHTLMINGVPYALRDALAVSTEAQELTEEQMAQARQNIGAATVAEVLAALPDGDEVAF